MNGKYEVIEVCGDHVRTASGWYTEGDNLCLLHPERQGIILRNIRQAPFRAAREAQRRAAKPPFQNKIRGL